MTEHVSTYIAPMFTVCPNCKAGILMPCVRISRSRNRVHRTPLTYTHAERNR